MNPYETEKLLGEYLLFHYGTAAEILPYPEGPHGALEYPARCVSECVGELPAEARALDLGCAVGRSSFELARRCREVIGIDYSRSFIEAAEALRAGGELGYERADEGPRTTRLFARVPPGIERDRVGFEHGDAQALRAGLGAFDVVLMANLIDRLREPARCLAQLAGLVEPGGQLVITSPYTWLEDYTPRANWLGGANGDTLDGLRRRWRVPLSLGGRRTSRSLSASTPGNFSGAWHRPASGVGSRRAWREAGKLVRWRHVDIAREAGGAG